MYDDDYPPCERTFVTLRVYSESAAPEEISARLRIEPSGSHVRGSHPPTATAPILPRSHGWFLSSEGQHRATPVATLTGCWTASSQHYRLSANFLQMAPERIFHASGYAHGATAGQRSLSGSSAGWLQPGSTSSTTSTLGSQKTLANTCLQLTGPHLASYTSVVPSGRRNRLPWGGLGGRVPAAEAQVR
jgi:hypothetical protein